MSVFLLTISVLAFFVCFWLLHIALKERSGAREGFDELTWLTLQIDRAIGQAQSKEIEEVLSGLQTLAVIVDESRLGDTLPVIQELCASSDARVAELATVVLTKLLRDPAKIGGSQLQQ